MHSAKDVLIGNMPLDTFWAKSLKAIRLTVPGERIVYKGEPYYVDQSIALGKEPENVGRIKEMVVSPFVDEPVLYCCINDLCEAFPLSEVCIPIIGEHALAQGDGDFFDIVHVGDAIDDELCSSLYRLLPLVAEKNGFFQMSGFVGKGVDSNGITQDTFLTVKRFPVAPNSPWRYIGHCAINDDIHLFI